MQLFALVLALKRKASFELYGQEGDAVHVLCDEVGATPITAEAHRHNPVAGEHAGDLLEIVGFLLPRIQRVLALRLL